MVTSTPTPTDRQLQILEHVARYGMTTERALRNQSFMEEQSEAAIRKQLTRLRKKGYLDSAPLFEQRVYHHLAPAGAGLLGFPSDKAKPFKDDPKVRAYAGLVFCSESGGEREKLTRQEFEENFEQLYKPRMRFDFYLNHGVSPIRLGYYRVDYSPRSKRWDRLITQLHEFVSARCENESFRELIQAGRFELTVITALADKAERLSEAMREADFPENLALDFYVINDLLPLIAPARSNS